MVRRVQDSQASTYDLEVDMIYDEEKSFFSQSLYTVAYNMDNEIVGSTRTMEHRGHATLPIEKSKPTFRLCVFSQSYVNS
ncbi:hypothetical protein [Sphingobacterium gobiense]|nr:hypothetical protein [Sphingobacterium gobiense]